MTNDIFFSYQNFVFCLFLSEERDVALEQSVADVWDEYSKQMKIMGLFDFDDLLFLTVKLLRENQNARKRIQTQYQHVLVDEFQDVNDIQFYIAKALVHSGPTNSIFAVGDPNQSVYAFRGNWKWNRFKPKVI